MTASCIHCGQVFDAPADPILDHQRQLRRKARLHTLLAEHLERHHKPQAEQATVLGIEFLGWCYLVNFTSSDPQFAAWVEEIRNRHHQATAPKEHLEPTRIVPINSARQKE